MSGSLAYQETQISEPPQQTKPLRAAESRSWVWLAIAAALLLFANGVDTVPLAAWFAPILLLRFVRTQSLKAGLPVAYVVLTATFPFQFRGMVPIPGVVYYIFLLLTGITLVLPYVVDRLLARRLSGFLAMLVFPAAWAAVEYLSSFMGYGTWGSAAYAMYGNLPLLQLLSVTGLWGITFLLGWVASTCNWLWEEGFASPQARRGAWACFGAVAAVLLLGGLRVALFPPNSQTVRVASISDRTVGPELSLPVKIRLFEGKATSEDLLAIRPWASAIDEDLLARAEREMQAGAKIVFWGEADAKLLKEDEAAFIARGQALAVTYNAYFGMAVGVLSMGKPRPLENKLVLIQPNGKVAWEYSKAHPVPGFEDKMQVLSDGKLRSLDTPYGHLSSVICFDADFPQLLAQGGALGADIMLVPSNDWQEIDPWHTQMASFRAIEQGFNLIRHTSHGLAAAYDYQGRQLAAMDHFRTADYALVSQVPTKGARTIYSRLGDWFAWVCIAVLILLRIQSLRRTRA